MRKREYSEVWSSSLSSWAKRAEAVEEDEPSRSPGRPRTSVTEEEEKAEEATEGVGEGEREEEGREASSDVGEDDVE